MKEVCSWYFCHIHLTRLSWKIKITFLEFTKILVILKIVNNLSRSIKHFSIKCLNYLKDINFNNNKKLDLNDLNIFTQANLIRFD